MKVKVNIREVVDDNASTYDGHIQVSAGIDIDDLFNSIPEENEIDIDIHELLAENRQIAHIWVVDDVKTLRPDLDDEQAWSVLQKVADRLHYDVGITWDVVETTADELYGGKPKPRWQGRIDVSVENYTRDEAIEHFTDLAAHIEKDAVNSTTKASFDPASLQPVEPNETHSK
jgi:hypothetical protein